MMEFTLMQFSSFVTDIRYGLYSLRSCGAITAARFGFSDRIFKLQSDISKDGYVKDYLSERMVVSQNLGNEYLFCFIYILDYIIFHI